MTTAGAPPDKTGVIDRQLPLQLEICTGTALEGAIPHLAALRVAVFREWPYLYDGDTAYETRYLRLYLRSAGAAVVLARDGECIVGASTCLPLADETDDVKAPFLSRGWDAGDFFYFGESVLLPRWRGHGIGAAFFAQREAHARKVSSARYATFCAVQRESTHPARPSGFVALDAFWRRRGYAPRPDMTCSMAWMDVGDAEETPKKLIFWMKPLTGAPLP